MRLVAIVIMLLTIQGLALGILDFSCSCYNNGDSSIEAVSGENINFKSSTILDPYSLSIGSSGSSTKSEGHYSYDLSLSGERLSSGAVTDGGAFSWSGSAKRKDDNRSLVLNPSFVVKDGTISFYYSNLGVEVRERVEAIDASFTEMTTLKPEVVNSQGRGPTLPWNDSYSTHSSDDQGRRGFTQVMLASSGQKYGKIETDILGDLSVSWKNAVSSSPSSFGFALELAGSSNNSSNDLLQMRGEATDFPTQLLPPGEISASLLPVNWSGLESINFNISTEVEEFSDRFNSKSSQALWYLFDQKTSLGPGESSPNVNYTLSGDRLWMRMGIGIGR